MNIKEILAVGDQYFTNGVVGTAIYCVLVYIFGVIIKKLVDRYVSHKINKHGRDAQTSYGFIKNTVHMVVNITTVFLMIMEVKAFHRLGTTFLGASGIIAVVLGFAAQESMSNFIGGFFLSFYKPFKVGDMINIPDKSLVGTVEEIGMRHTVIRTFTNSKIVVPNSVMNNSIIENRSLDIGKYCNFLIINISYASDISKASEIIQRLALKHPNCIDARAKKEKESNQPIVAVIVTGLKDSSIELRASVYSKDVSLGFTMLCDLRKQIKETFDAEGIIIPFPTQTVVLKK